MNPILISLAAEVGAPLVEKILSEKFGKSTGGMVGNVLDAIAGHAGTTADQLPDLARSNPPVVRDAIMDAEAMAPELVALYSRGLEYQLSIQDQEARGPLWTWAWRPAGMWGIGILWFWSVIVLHVINAIYKTAIPPMPLESLLGLTALYSGLYMGGHTVKNVASKYLGARK